MDRRRRGPRAGGPGLRLAWARTPAGAHDALGVLLDLPNTVVEPLGREVAGEVGGLLAGGDVDAVRAGQVAASGLRRGWPVVTADSAPLRAVDPRVEVDELPEPGLGKRAGGVAPRQVGVGRG